MKNLYYCSAIILVAEIMAQFAVWLNLKAESWNAEEWSQKSKEFYLFWKIIGRIDTFVMLLPLAMIPFCLLIPKMAITVGFILGGILYFVGPIELFRINMVKQVEERNRIRKAHFMALVCLIFAMRVALQTDGRVMPWFYIITYGYCLPCTLLWKAVDKIRGYRST